MKIKILQGVILLERESFVIIHRMAYKMLAKRRVTLITR